MLAALALALALTESTARLPEPTRAPVPQGSMQQSAAVQPPITPGQGRLQALTPAEVVRIVDGDTVEMRIAIWLDQHVVTRVRIRGIDAPERGGRCPEEARRAELAAEALERLLSARPLFLAEVSRDKYGGRVVARIFTSDGGDVGMAMLAAGHARRYAAGRRETWC